MRAPADRTAASENGRAHSPEAFAALAAPAAPAMPLRVLELHASRIAFVEELQPRIASLLEKNWVAVAHSILTANREDLTAFEACAADPLRTPAEIAHAALALVELVQQRALLEGLRRRGSAASLDGLLHVVSGLRAFVPAGRAGREELWGAVMRWQLNRPETRYSNAALCEAAELLAQEGADPRAWAREFLALFPASGLLTSERGHDAAEVLLKAACRKGAWGRIPEAVFSALHNIARFNLEQLKGEPARASFPFKPSVFSSPLFIAMAERNAVLLSKDHLSQLFLAAERPGDFLDAACRQG